MRVSGSWWNLTPVYSSGGQCEQRESSAAFRLMGKPPRRSSQAPGRSARVPQASRSA
jgi:hypothetical protein